MKVPARDGGHDERPRAGYQTRNTCPWPCLAADQLEELTDSTGTVRAMICRLCDNTITRTMWLDELDRAAAAGARP